METILQSMYVCKICSKMEDCCCLLNQLNQVLICLSHETVFIIASYVITDYVSKSFLQSPLPNIDLLRCHIIKQGKNYHLQLQFNKQTIGTKTLYPLMIYEDEEDDDNLYYDDVKEEQDLKIESPKSMQAKTSDILVRDTSRMILQSDTPYVPQTVQFMYAKAKRMWCGRRYYEFYCASSRQLLGSIKYKFKYDQFIVKDHLRHRIMAICKRVFSYDSMTLENVQGPIKLCVTIGKNLTRLDCDKNIERIQLTSEEEDLEIINRNHNYQLQHDHEIKALDLDAGLQHYQNIRPIWNGILGLFSVSFDKNPEFDQSVKNIKLIRNEDENKLTILQFGRTNNRNRFILDFAYPLSTLQAFAIAMASIM
jgi:hypothetical protein